MAQGNALWVAKIKSADFTGDELCWRREAVDGGDFPFTSAWHFLPLAEIAELAKEHVAEVMIFGLLDQRMTTIPVMFDGLAENSGGRICGSSSEGISYHYGASIERIGKDFVTLSVHLTVGRPGSRNSNLM